jgi:predicted NUDIX family NTP pyrophosphohydrolase
MGYPNCNGKMVKIPRVDRIHKFSPKETDSIANPNIHEDTGAYI